MTRSSFCVLSALCGCLLVTACASTPSVMKYHQPEHEIVVPAPPDPPRYQLVGTLTGENNFTHQEKRSVGEKLLTWVTGLLFGDTRSHKLQKPSSGLVDSETGRVFVTDVGAHQIFVFDPALGEFDVWDSADAYSGFQTPIAIAKVGQDQFWVTDADLVGVFRLSSDGKPLGRVDYEQFIRPTGIASDPDSGRVFVADSKAHDIKVFAANGEYLESFGKKGDGDGAFNGPTHLAVADGRLYVTDTLNSRVQIFSVDGRFLKSFGKRGLYLGDMPRPKGVAVDDVGRIYVVESYYDYLLVYDAEGRLLLPIGSTGSRPGQFYLPAGVWTDGGDQIFVADMFNGRVVSFKYVGTDKGSPSGTQE